MAIDDSRDDRQCPRCNKDFEAIFEREACPNCSLFFRRDRNAQPIGITPTFVTPLQFEPVDELCASSFETIHFGGGPIFQSDRNGAYPDLATVHSQLLAKFEAITRSIRPHLPNNASSDCEASSLADYDSHAISAKLVA